jgi:terminal uridylyltransferase
MSAQLDIIPNQVSSLRKVEAAHHQQTASQDSQGFYQNRRQQFPPYSQAPNPLQTSKASWLSGNQNTPQMLGNPLSQNQRNSQRNGRGTGHQFQEGHEKRYEPSHRIGGYNLLTNRNSTQPFIVITAQEIELQAILLENLSWAEITKAEMTMAEINEKDVLRAKLESICQSAVSKHKMASGHSQIRPNDVSLQCFGSVRSGFATKGSDMDLALISPLSQPPASSRESPIPRVLEKALLDLGFGARLLTRTRVPIIRFCEKPSSELLELLRAEHEKWKQEVDSNNSIGYNGQDTKSSTSNSKEIETPVDQISNDTHGKTPEDAKTELSTMLQSLRQKSRESLYTYFRRVRNIMIESGVQDFHRAQKESFNQEELKALLQFVESFAKGIDDENLRNRLLSAPNMDYQAAYLSGRIISLYGTWLQAEGEKYVSVWEERKVREPLEARENELKKLVEDWESLVTAIDMTPNQRIQSLRRVGESFKKFGSIRLAALNQSHDETIGNYRSRALAILQDLNAKDLLSGSGQQWLPTDIRVVRELNQKLVSGIYDDSLRQAAAQFLSGRGNISVQETSDQLEAEYRIWQYEKAIKLEKLTKEEKEAVSSYAGLIRKHGTSFSNSDVQLAAKKLDTVPLPSAKANRDRFGSSLDFPKQGVGILCDINFSNVLALHNTALLRCYSLCDIRVRPMILFVKAWAKRRMINSPYRGTLSSYGYVLMVLHYLINIVEPPVLPNLQLEGKRMGLSDVIVEDYNVSFWRDEEAIMSRAAAGSLLRFRNQQPLGFLLRGFFDYYAGQGSHVTGRGFWWANDALSLRTQGGLLTKQAKGWTGARTTITEAHGDEGRREVRHRYLMAIEDPFEVDHNVARTVMHDGIVKIRDEFRRAWAMISNAGQGPCQDSLALLLGNDQNADDQDV